VKDGLFREDLFHRLNVIRLRLPSLRERREDIPILTKFFLQQSSKQLGGDPKRLTDTAMQFLCALELPGNVRQLQNLCNWITVMAPGQTVEVTDLPQELLNEKGLEKNTLIPIDAAVASQTIGNNYVTPIAVGQLPNMPSADWLSLLEAQAARMLADEQAEVMDVLARQFESSVIKMALRHTHGRKNDAAIRLGIGRNTITRKIQELGIAGAKED
jgi:two-component system nitrogen regulation response regulator GlnG